MRQVSSFVLLSKLGVALTIAPEIFHAQQALYHSSLFLCHADSIVGVTCPENTTIRYHWMYAEQLRQGQKYTSKAVLSHWWRARGQASTRLAPKQSKIGRSLLSNASFLHGFDSLPTVNSGKAGGDQSDFPVEMV